MRFKLLTFLLLTNTIIFAEGFFPPSETTQETERQGVKTVERNMYMFSTKLIPRCDKNKTQIYYGRSSLRMPHFDENEAKENKGYRFSIVQDGHEEIVSVCTRGEEIYEITRVKNRLYDKKYPNGYKPHK